MLFILFLIVFFASSDSWSASRSLAFYNEAQVESKRQKEIREQFFPQGDQRRTDVHLDITGLPHDVLDIVRGYLRDDRECWAASVQSQEVVEEGALRVFTAGTKEALFAVFQMPDYSLKVKKITANGAELLPVLSGHSTTIISVAITPNGRYLCAPASDRIFRVWDLQTGACKLARWVLPFLHKIEFFEAGDYFYLMAYNDYWKGIYYIYPRVGEHDFDFNVDDDEDPAGSRIQELHDKELLLTFQDLGDGKSLAVAENHCFIRDRKRQWPHRIYQPIQDLPKNLLAGRMSETYNNTLFILSDDAFYTYSFDITKQEPAQLISVKPLKKMRFSFPSEVMLSDDGHFCAGVSENHLDVWELTHEIRLYHMPFSEDNVVSTLDYCEVPVPIRKLFFSPQGHSFSVVDDKRMRVTCHFFDPEIAQHLYSLTLADSSCIQKIIEKSSSNSTKLVLLDGQERSGFTLLPTCVQENIKKVCRVNSLEGLSAQQQQIVDLFLAKPRTTPPQKVKLTKAGTHDFASLPNSIRDDFEKAFTIYRPWAWWKKTALTTASVVALDFLVSRLLTKKPMLLQRAWHLMLSAAVTSKKV